MPTIKVTLTESGLKELRLIAVREKRSINNQASYMIESMIPNMKVRSSIDSDTIAFDFLEEAE